MKLYNTLTNKKETFEPLKDDTVKIYACGPTVYDYFHIGNARPFIIFDCLRRYLEYKGYRVLYVQNYTDIDDKMINKAKLEGLSVKELADRFIAEYQKDAKNLGIREANVHPKATEHIDSIIALISRLMDKKLAYQTENGVYFDTQAYEGYGKLSKKDSEELEAGARVDVEEGKKNPMDFVLWKAKKEGEPFWDSPWGEGRPGWHIECSAMAMEYLGETIDIHCGGADLVFPHHENEIAQSEGATGKTFSRFWLHNGFINIDHKKMSKSEGNFFTVRDIVQKFDYEVLRFFLLSAHYRSPINFSQSLLEQAKSGLERIYDCLDRLDTTDVDDKSDESLESNLDAFSKRFDEAMDNDLNTAEAIGVLFELVRYAYACMQKNTLSTEQAEAIAVTIRNKGALLGILQKKQEKTLDDELEALIEQRQKARSDRNWALADKIRDQLKDRGIILEDTPDGVKWKKG